MTFQKYNTALKIKRVALVILVAGVTLTAFNNCGPGQNLLNTGAVTNAPSLSSLVLSVGSLTPAFDPAVTSYTLNVSFLSAGVGVIPNIADSSVSMTLNGSAITAGVLSSPVSVAAGTTTALNLVLTKDGVSKTYTINVTRDDLNTFAQQAYAKASNTNTSDGFRIVAADGNTLVVGAPGEDSNATGINGNEADNTFGGSGAVYVFVRSGNTWTQQAYIKASNTEANDVFGSSVDIDGDTLVVGAPNEDSNATGSNGNEADNSLNNAGAVYVFVRNGSTWTQQAYIKASNPGSDDNFGERVTISGNTIAVTAKLEDSNATGINGNQTNETSINSGAAYVFVRSGTTWAQQAYIKASNTDASDFFGWSIGLSEDTLVVGSVFESSNATGVNGDQSNNSATQSGAAYVFIRNGSTWTQQAYLKASNTGSSDVFGNNVAIDGNTIVVTSFYEDSNATGVNGDQSNNSATQSGAAYVFVRSGTTWTQQAYIKASNTGANDEFGTSVALNGNTLAIGAPLEDSNALGINGNDVDNSAANSGAAYVFVRSGTTWTQQAYIKASNTDPNDLFAISIALNVDSVFVGATAESSNATGIGGNQANNTAASSGAAYIFK